MSKQSNDNIEIRSYIDFKAANILAKLCITNGYSAATIRADGVTKFFSDSKGMEQATNAQVDMSIRVGRKRKIAPDEVTITLERYSRYSPKKKHLHVRYELHYQNVKTMSTCTFETTDGTELYGRVRTALNVALYAAPFYLIHGDDDTQKSVYEYQRGLFKLIYDGKEDF